MATNDALDASALRALLSEKQGATHVRAALNASVISAVNYSEVVAKLADRGGNPAAVSAGLAALHLGVVAFDQSQAAQAGALITGSRAAGLVFGDRSCLALATSRSLIALTADRSWTTLRPSVQIECIR
ncbi:type II toxin-antitoxin system VapC family toxin [Methylobacterium sp. J-030]|uniref:type II toxin-antitoxin system VapC family toxin n=1 Tax=Methylobacterium sp. J-030 TaxID=2836627 RepID=UPI001FB9F6DC|nr:type II toxin-antitoxin system VapC family toxin [Methylobacterium sp. J-030]MCJ2068631.1 type II toxin-antitoxin system VapC family toxin [Methylobacterium sp. J-030]